MIKMMLIRMMKCLRKLLKLPKRSSKSNRKKETATPLLPRNLKLLITRRTIQMIKMMLYQRVTKLRQEQRGLEVSSQTQPRKLPELKDLECQEEQETRKLEMLRQLILIF